MKLSQHNETQEVMDMNFLELDDLMSDGYGMVAQKVARAIFISGNAKNIYMYVSSFAGCGDTQFPSTTTMRTELNMCKDTFYKARKELEELGIIKVTTKRTRNGARTTYKLMNNAHISETVKNLYKEREEAKGRKVNNLPNAPEKPCAPLNQNKNQTHPKPVTVQEQHRREICNTPEGFDELERISLKHVRSDEYHDAIQAYLKAVAKGYDPDTILEAYGSYIERYRREHPDTLKYAKRLPNYLKDSDGLYFDAGVPINRYGVIKKTPEARAIDIRAHVEREVIEDLTKNNKEYAELSERIIKLRQEMFMAQRRSDESALTSLLNQSDPLVARLESIRNKEIDKKMAQVKGGING